MPRLRCPPHRAPTDPDEGLMQTGGARPSSNQWGLLRPECFAFSTPMLTSSQTLHSCRGPREPWSCWEVNYNTQGLPSSSSTFTPGSFPKYLQQVGRDF